MALILHTNGSREDINPDGKYLTLEQIQATVGFFEVVRVPYSHNLLLIDEEGLLNGKSINVKASRLAQRPIVGDVIICVEKNSEYL